MDKEDTCTDFATQYINDIRRVRTIMREKSRSRGTRGATGRPPVRMKQQTSARGTHERHRSQALPRLSPLPGMANIGRARSLSRSKQHCSAQAIAARATPVLPDRAATQHGRADAKKRRVQSSSPETNSGKTGASRNATARGEVQPVHETLTMFSNTNKYYRKNYSINEVRRTGKHSFVLSDIAGLCSRPRLLTLVPGRSESIGSPAYLSERERTSADASPAHV